MNERRIGIFLNCVELSFKILLRNNLRIFFWKTLLEVLRLKYIKIACKISVFNKVFTFKLY